jgi:DNA-binding MarR family transcriptional regulator
MRDKEMDDLLVLAVVAKAGMPLNKYKIKREALTLKMDAERNIRKQFPQPITYRAIREAIERLHERGEIEAAYVEPGRAPHTRSVFYKLTELGEAALRTPKSSRGLGINVERARQIVEEREKKKWTPEADRAYAEMHIAYNWLLWQLGNVIAPALPQTRRSRDAEKLARTVLNIMTADLARFIRACYRHRDVKVENNPVFDYVLDSFAFDELDEEECRAWLERFAPSEFREYTGKLPYSIIALDCILSRSKAEARRDLAKDFRAFDASTPRVVNGVCSRP